MAMPYVWRGIDGQYLEATIAAVGGAAGAATVPTGASSVVVTHGLARTPTFVTVSPRAAPTMGAPTYAELAAGTVFQQFYVDTVGATQFTLHTTRNVAVDLPFDWITF